MDWTIFWSILIAVAGGLAWLACNHFETYNVLIKPVCVICGVILAVIIVFNSGVKRGAFVVEDVYREAMKDGGYTNLMPVAQVNASPRVNNEALIPGWYAVFPIGILVYSGFMLWIGEEIAKNSAKKTGSKRGERKKD